MLLYVRYKNHSETKARLLSHLKKSIITLMTTEIPTFTHEGSTYPPESLSPEHGESYVTPPFVLKCSADDRKTFVSVMEKMALAHMIGMPGPMTSFKEARGKVFSESEKDLLGRLEVIGDERHLGPDLDMVDRLQFRWVATSPAADTNKLVQDAYIYGGNAPHDRSSWTHVGNSIVEDIMRQPTHESGGVLFIYDGGKLTPITQGDIDSDRADPAGKHMYMHAQKPLPGLDLKDALVGMISFDSPQNLH